MYADSSVPEEPEPEPDPSDSDTDSEPVSGVHKAYFVTWFGD